MGGEHTGGPEDMEVGEDPSKWVYYAKNKRHGKQRFMGFWPLVARFIGKAKYVVFCVHGDTYSMWMLRDEEAYGELVRYFVMYADVKPDCYLMKPHSLWSGEWEVDRFMKDPSA